MSRTLSPLVSGGKPQLNLALSFESFSIERSCALLNDLKVQSHLVHEFAGETHTFGFDLITEPPALTFELLASAPQKHETITAHGAHEKLLEMRFKAEKMPLCIWAANTVLDYRANHNMEELLPPKPNPEHRVIIMTQGWFSPDPGEEYSQLLCLVENANGGFDVKVYGRFHTFEMYKKPGFDVVALCVPFSVCAERHPEV